MELFRVHVKLVAFCCICLLQLLGSIDICAQNYTATGSYFLDNGQVKVEELNKYFWKGNKDVFRLYHMITDSVSVVTIVKDIDLNTMAVVRTDTITDVGVNFFHRDIIVHKDYDIILGNSRMYIYNRKKRKGVYKDFNQYGGQNFFFDKGYVVNDSLILLYDIYDFHPFSGLPGIYLNAFNVNTGEFVLHKKAKFPGVGLSYMAVNWGWFNKANFYAVSPMSGILYKYNMSLELTDSVKMPIKWSDYSKNIQFQKALDERIANNYNKLYGILLKYGLDSIDKNPALGASDMNTKEYISNLIDTVRTHYEYIEKILPYNDSVFIITVCRGGDYLKYRDVYFYNVVTNKVIKEKERWLCSRKDNLERFEDFFVIDVICSEDCAPCFYEGHAYKPTFYNQTLYHNGTKNELEKTIHKDITQNQYQWRLLEYEF